ncbi:hypothetical protein [Clostridium baratii]|uniref:hypothetical protein n=1 Tax=Clostridium baratii TaxID=1561 RepID=UPI0022E5D022|nr:hypothetical protein [Clostridium baratii]
MILAVVLPNASSPDVAAFILLLFSLIEALIPFNVLLYPVSSSIYLVVILLSISLPILITSLH